MSLHPKNISRRRREARYVLVHRNPEFAVRLNGVRFVNGKTDPIPPAKAAQVCAAMGSKLRYGYRLDAPHVFGDPTPAERAAALAAAGAKPPLRQRIEALFQRAADLGLDGTDESVDAALAELEALPEEDRERLLAQYAETLDDIESARTDGDEDDEDDEDDEPSFVDGEKPPVPAPDDPLRFTRAQLNALGTKEQLAAWAQDTLQLALDPRRKKDELIDAIFADARVVEMPEEPAPDAAQSAEAQE